MKKILLSLFLMLPAQSWAALPTCEHWYKGPQGEAFQAKIDKLTQSVRIPGNEIEIIPEARQSYHLRERLIKQAQDHVHLYTLLIEDNETGVATATLLGEKASLEGVEVNLIYSPLVQAATSSNRIITALKAMGVRTHPYFAKKTIAPLSQLVIGPHKKSLIVDSQQYGLEAVIGGRNIGDSYFADLDDAPYADFTNLWRDTDIFLRGPAIIALVDDFIQDFNTHSDTGLTITCANGSKVGCRYYPALSTSGEHEPITMRVLENEPNAFFTRGVYEANIFYEEMIDHAETSLVIETPYFIPQNSLLKRLHAALDRGVAVRILTNGEEANDLGGPLFYASIYYWTDLIEAGAEIYQWDVKKSRTSIARTMHSKVAIADGCVFVPGSWNFDGRSYAWENEYLFPMNSPTLAQTALDMVETDLGITGVTRVDERWMRRNFSFFDRILAAFYAQTLSNLL